MKPGSFDLFEKVEPSSREFVDEGFSDKYEWRNSRSIICRHARNFRDALDEPTITEVFQLVLWMRQKVADELGEHELNTLESDFLESMLGRCDLYTIMLSHNYGREPHEFELPCKFNGWNGRFGQMSLDHFAGRILEELPKDIFSGFLPAVQLAHHLHADDADVEKNIARLWQTLFFYKNQDQYTPESLMFACQKLFGGSSAIVSPAGILEIDMNSYLHQVVNLVARGKENMIPLVGVDPDKVCLVAEKLGLIPGYSLMDILDAFPDADSFAELGSIVLTVPMGVQGQCLFGKTYANYSGTEYTFTHVQGESRYCILNMAKPDMGFGETEDLIVSWSLPRVINLVNLFDILLSFMRELEEIFGVDTHGFCSHDGKTGIENLDDIPSHLDVNCDGFTIRNKFFSLGVWGSMDEWTSLREHPEEHFVFLKANGAAQAKPFLPTGWKERLFEATSRFTQETGKGFPTQVVAPGVPRLKG